jgi:hypothetical protein
VALTPEGKVKAEIKKLLKIHGVWFYMPVQNGYGKVGIPDFICCFNGKFLAIEAKAPGKESALTPNQRNVLEAIDDHGGVALVISGNTDALIAFIVASRMGR